MSGSLPAVRMIPPDRLYWAVLDASELPKGLPLLSRASHQRRLGYLFEAVLPTPIEQVHPIYTSLDGGRVLACAMDRDELRGHIDEGALSLTPGALPAGLDIDQQHERVDLIKLELLTGAMTPPARRRATNRWRLHAAVLLLLVCAVLAIGFQRRQQWHDLRRAETESQIARVYNAALPQDGPSSQPPALRLLAEQRRLEQTRTTDQQPVRDVVADLTMVLVAWPKLNEIKTESLSAADETITVRALLPGHADATRLYEALNQIDGVTVDQPRIDRQRDGVRVTLRITPDQEPSL